MKANTNQHQWLLNLYNEAFPAVAKYIAARGGSLDDAKDIFQEALVIFYEKTAAGNLQVTHTDKAYLLGISRHLWYHQQQKQNRLSQQPVENLPDIAASEPDEPSASRLLRVLETAGKKCMDLLQAFYYDKLNMKQLATQFNLSGERSATVQKHKCMEKVRETVKQKSLTYEDFCN